jgi:hypothetical protein
MHIDFTLLYHMFKYSAAILSSVDEIQCRSHVTLHAISKPDIPESSVCELALQ